MVGTPLQGEAKNSQGGAKIFRLASLAISYPPDQNSETAPGYNLFFKKNIFTYLQWDIFVNFDWIFSLG